MQTRAPEKDDPTAHPAPPVLDQKVTMATVARRNKRLAAYGTPAVQDHGQPPQVLLNPFPVPLPNPVPTLMAESVWTQVGDGHFAGH